MNKPSLFGSIGKRIMLVAASLMLAACSLIPDLPGPIGIPGI
jgi:hypothetical protein